MTSYTFSVGDNFTDSAHITTVTTAISSAYPTFTTLDIINQNSININFSGPLTDSDAIGLYNLVCSYDVNLGSQFKFIPINMTTINKYFTLITSIKMPILPINITINSYINKSGSYDIKLYNVTQRNIVATGTFTNVDNVENILTISNVPQTRDIIELHAKVSGSETLNIYSVTFYY
jgi:hypothetical protein